jgi:hypothetical protein
MRQQILGLFLSILVFVSVCGVGYSQWNDIIEIHTTMRFGNLTLRFVGSPSCSDNDDAKDVGETTCEYDNLDPEVGGFKTLKVSITNSYPSCEAHCTFTLQNVGTFTEEVKNIVMKPGAGLITGETYVDAVGRIVGWQLIDAITNEPKLKVYIYDGTGSSLVTHVLDLKELLPGSMTVRVEENAGQCSTYSFEVEIAYE